MHRRGDQRKKKTIGLSDTESATLERAARLVGRNRTRFTREAALAVACLLLNEDKARPAWLPMELARREDDDRD